MSIDFLSPGGGVVVLLEEACQFRDGLMRGSRLASRRFWRD